MSKFFENSDLDINKAENIVSSTLNKCDDGEGNRDDLKRIQVWRQSSADLYATTLGFSRKRSRNEYEDIVATNFETLQQSRNRIH